MAELSGKSENEKLFTPNKVVKEMIDALTKGV